MRRVDVRVGSWRVGHGSCAHGESESFAFLAPKLDAKLDRPVSRNGQGALEVETLEP
jgi:hypothetical protein